MVGHQYPSETFCVGLDEKGGKTVEKRVAVFVIDEDIALLDASDHDMLQDTNCIETSKSWHAKTLAHTNQKSKSQQRPLKAHK